MIISRVSTKFIVQAVSSTVTIGPVRAPGSDRMYDKATIEAQTTPIATRIAKQMFTKPDAEVLSEAEHPHSVER